MTLQHAPIQPSSASRWVHCAGSVMLEALYPESDRDAAAEGELAHAVCAAMLQGQPEPAGPVTEEMRDGAEMLFDDVSKIRHVLGNPDVKIYVETRVRAPSIHNDCWGTPDVYLLVIIGNVLYVWDYKFGHRYVSPYENWQLLTYAIAILEMYGTATTDQLMVHLRIVQPRNFHPDGPVREWVIPARDLWSYRQALHDAAHLAMTPNPPTKTNAECRDCKARHACPTLQGAAYHSVHTAGVAVPFDLSPEAAGRELVVMQDAADVLKARISGLEDQVLGEIKRGKPVRGFMTKQGQGRQRWKDGVIAEVQTMGQLMAIDLTKPALITPKQAIKAGIPEAVVAGYSETPMGEITLVRDDGAQARRVFGSPTRA